ncbi:hypothetical protein [Collinsella intestinalis]|uniref:hypothetical protein n=1 Tax=Collinsella intestinalis TaxID=147207 RepID=UPI0025A3C806|nr:hypothetical protein [Collinsella intestinalis]MDM8162430.1 hypothetical protein [Collinsella intestinalis]
MITDDERRRVSEKLRASIPGDGVMRRGDKGWSLLYRTIFGHYMSNQSAGRTYSEVAGRLADLIEPSIPADPGEAGLACVDAFIREHTEKPVDRDALLALADEMEEFGNLPVKHPGIRVLQNDDFSRELGYARRIRKALGVEK